MNRNFNSEGHKSKNQGKTAYPLRMIYELSSKYDKKN